MVGQPANHKRDDHNPWTHIQHLDWRRWGGVRVRLSHNTVARWRVLIGCNCSKHNTVIGASVTADCLESRCRFDIVCAALRTSDDLAGGRLTARSKTFDKTAKAAGKQQVVATRAEEEQKKKAARF